MSNICIVIPAYNEDNNIIKLIQLIRKYLKCYIVIIDDSENVSTSNLFKKLKLDNVLYFHRGKKLGRGSAVIFGLKKVYKNKKIKVFIEMDADLSHSPKELNRNIKYFFDKKADLLISSRYLKKSKINNWSILRKILSYLANKLARLLLSIPVSDYTNGFRIYSRNACKIIITKCGKIGDGFIILSEILQEINNAKLKITEIDSIFNNRVRGESSVNTKTFLVSLLGLIKLFLRRIFN